MEEARHALRSYGYADEDGRWYSRRKRTRTQSWEETDGGFLRWDPDNGGWYAVPYVLREEFQGTGGLDFKNEAHAYCFDFVWPADVIAHNYTVAHEAQRAQAEAHAADKAIRLGRPVEPVVEPAPEPEPEPEAPRPNRTLLDRMLGGG